jgi:hypothetical protein
MTFRQWLEQGTKISGTGLNSGGMAQHGRTYRLAVKPAKNIKTKIKPFKSF